MGFKRHYRREWRDGIMVGLVIFVVVVGLTAVGVVWSWKNWQIYKGNITTEMKIQPITELPVEEATYHLVNGWNLIAFPMTPVSVVSASEIVSDVADAGGYVTMVSRWDGDWWQEYASRGVEQYGTDFPIQPGEAYFILNHTPVDWKVMGRALPRDENYGKVVLRPGWNAIGLTPAAITSAKGVLEALHTGGGESATEIDKWYSGNWRMLVKRWYSASNVQEYGDDFPLSNQEGYMIKALDTLLLDTAQK